MDVLFEHSLPFFRASSGTNEFPSEKSVSTPTNYVGALIFWSYIGAALYLVWDILRTLLALHKFSKYRQHDYSRAGVAFFGACALLSFASLSYRMLDVLVQSYASWAGRQAGRGAGAETLFDLLSGSSSSSSTGPSSLAGLAALLSDIWTWSISTSHFADFATAITATGARWVWAQADLGVTLVTAYWMALEGRRGTGASDDAAMVPVPKLWTFFALLQILPTSLTQALFMLALLLSPPPPPTLASLPSQRTSKGSGGSKQETTEKRTEVKKRTVILLGKPGYWITTGLIYCFLLVEVTQPERRDWLLPMMLVARALLWAPLVFPFARLRPIEGVEGSDEEEEEKISGKKMTKGTGKTQNNNSTTKPKTKTKAKEAKGKDKEEEETADEEPPKDGFLPDPNAILDKASPMQLIDMPLALLAMSGWAVLHQTYWAREDFGTQGILQALHQHPAVSALGYDFMIAAGIFMSWQLFGKRLRTKSG